MDGTVEIGLYDARGERTGTRRVAIGEVVDMTAFAPAPTSASVVRAEGARAWFVVQSVMRGEKNACEALREQGYSTFRPVMRKELHRHRGTKTTFVREFPLFNRYLFAELPSDPRDWPAVMADREIIAGTLGNDGVPQPVKEGSAEEPRTVRWFMAKQEGLAFDDTEEARLRRGEIGRTRRETIAKRFAAGSQLKVSPEHPFGGFYGQVVDVTGKGTVRAMLQLFGAMRLVEFAPGAVEPA